MFEMLQVRDDFSRSYFGEKLDFLFVWRAVNFSAGSHGFCIQSGRQETKKNNNNQTNKKKCNGPHSKNIFCLPDESSLVKSYPSER